MSDKPSLQSGRTQAIDLDEIESKRKKSSHEQDDWSAGNWNDPWSEGPAQRRWSEDDRWMGDNESKVAAPDEGGRTKALDLSDLQGGAGGALPDGGASGGDGDDGWGAPQAKGGWSAPKRDEMMASGDGWDDWNDGGGGGEQKTMALALDDLDQQKDLGGRRKNQAAASYDHNDTAAYGDGRARRRDIYQSKEDLDAKDRGFSDYAGGERRQYGGQVSQDDGWSSSPPPASGISSMPGSEPAPERTVALDLADAHFGGPAPTAAIGVIPGELPGADLGPTLGSLVIFSPNVQPVVFPLSRGVISIGRGLENNVVLADPYSSRKHLLVMFRHDQFEVHDAGTDNGTSVNGQRIAQALLRHGDHIEVGSTVLRFVNGEAGPNEMLFGPAPPIPPHHLTAPPDSVPVMAQMIAQPPRRNKGLLVVLVGLVVVFVIGVAAIAVYFLAFADKGSKGDPDVTNEDTSTGYEAGTVPTGTQNDKLDKAMEALDDAGEAGATGEAATSAAEPASEVQQDTKVVIAAMAGSVAMATGNPKPLPVQVLGESISIRIESDPIDAEIFDSAGNLRGRTPYQVSELKTERVEQWTVTRGSKSVPLDIDFSSDTNETVKLRSSSSSSSRRRTRRTTPRTHIPTVD